jgi:hypothetical protein
MSRINCKVLAGTAHQLLVNTPCLNAMLERLARQTTTQPSPGHSLFSMRFVASGGQLMHVQNEASYNPESAMDALRAQGIR